MKVGDEVVVTGRHVNGGEPLTTTVTSVRRKYFSVDVGTRFPRSMDFQIDNGLERVVDGHGNYRAKARTPEQVAHDIRMAQARDTFEAAGLAFKLGARRLTDEQALHIADYLRSEGFA